MRASRAAAPTSPSAFLCHSARAPPSSCRSASSMKDACSMITCLVRSPKRLRACSMSKFQVLIRTLGHKLWYSIAGKRLTGTMSCSITRYRYTSRGVSTWTGLLSVTQHADDASRSSSSCGPWRSSTARDQHDNFQKCQSINKPSLIYIGCPAQLRRPGTWHKCLPSLL
jgi:hypothetical protein